MQWWPISLLNSCSWLEGVWRRAYNLAAGGRNAQYGQAAFVGTISTETEDSVDTGKARRVGQYLLAEALRSLCFDKGRYQRDGVVSKCRGPHRILSNASPVAAGEIAEASRFWRGIPTAIKRRA
jgi:hypothetical protein